jgi:hypothetical protein
VQHASIICCDAALLFGHASPLSSANCLSPETRGSGGESADAVAPVMLNPASTVVAAAFPGIRSGICLVAGLAARPCRIHTRSALSPSISCNSVQFQIKFLLFSS